MTKLFCKINSHNVCDKGMQCSVMLLLRYISFCICLLVYTSACLLTPFFSCFLALFLSCFAFFSCFLYAFFSCFLYLLSFVSCFLLFLAFFCFLLSFLFFSCFICLLLFLSFFLSLLASFLAFFHVWGLILFDFCLSLPSDSPFASVPRCGFFTLAKVWVHPLWLGCSSRYTNPIGAAIVRAAPASPPAASGGTTSWRRAVANAAASPR